MKIKSGSGNLCKPENGLENVWDIEVINNKDAIKYSNSANKFNLNSKRLDLETLHDFEINFKRRRRNALANIWNFGSSE